MTNLTELPTSMKRLLAGTARVATQWWFNFKRVCRLVFISKASATSLDPFFGAATLLGSVGSLRAAETTDRYRRGSTSHEEDMYRDFPFPFENLVFEGGGNKGMAYVGALQVSVECVLLF